MTRTKQIREAVISLNFPKVEHELKKQKLTPEMPAALLQIIRNTGALLLAHENSLREGLRDDFIRTVRKWFADNSESAIRAQLEKHIKEATLCEGAYRAIYKSLEQSPHGQVSEAVSAWATLFNVATDITDMSRAISSETRHFISDDLVFLSPESLRVSHLGRPDLDPDVAAERYALNVGGYLKMLGYRKGWFDNGILVLPSHAAVPTDLLEDRSSLFLAEVWNQLEWHWELIRYFESSSADLAIQSHTTNRGERQAPTLTFQHDWPYLLDIEIARSRLRRQVFETFMHVIGDPRTVDVIHDPTKSAVAAFPRGLISIQEAAAMLILDLCYGLNLQDNKALYLGLTLGEWLRGYALLQLCSERDYALTRIAEGISYLDEPEFIKLAHNSGLDRNKATLFLKQATLQKNSRDLWDSPLIRTTANRYILLTCLTRNSALHEALTSRINSLLIQIATKGPNFEEEVRQEFQALGGTAKSIEYRNSEGKFECDSAVLWNHDLFLIESKAYVLPQASGSDLYFFRCKQEEAADQIRRIARHLADDPTILERTYGHPIELARTTLCVMNLAPFCRPGKDHDVKFYDRRALSKFGEGEVRAVLNKGLGTETATRTSAPLAKLWDGKEPTPDDLLAQMNAPFQYAVESRKWRIIDCSIALSPDLVIRSSFWERLPDEPFNL
jgi:hypothetical protein